MKRTLLLLVFQALCLNILPQTNDLEKVFNLLYPHSIKPHTGDTTHFFIEKNEAGNYLRVSGTETPSEIKLWPLKNFTLVALANSENDMVMTHQRISFYLLKNDKLEETQPLPNLYLSSFFDERYVSSRQVNAGMNPDWPVFTLSPDSDLLTVELQDETFDRELMGEIYEMTRLDPEKIAVTKITMEPDESGRFNIVQRQYRVDDELELNMKGGWESWCEETCFFILDGKDHYRFSNDFSRHGDEEMQVIARNGYDSTHIEERILYTYGKRISETEGVVFYDSAFVKDKNAQWFAAGRKKRLVPDKNGSFFIAKDHTGMKTLMLKGTTTKQADAAITQKYPGLFSLPPDADAETRENRRLSVYPYAVELTFLFYTKGKAVQKTIVMRIRQGEC